MSRLAYYICSHDAKADPKDPAHAKHYGYTNPTHEAPIYLGDYAADVIEDALSGQLALTRLLDMPAEKLPAECDDDRE